MSSFRGFLALLLAKQRLITHVLVPLGVAGGFVSGLLARLGGSDAADTLPVFAVMFLGACVTLGPLAAAGGDTFTGAQAGTRARREELLALPIGRLAIPAAHLVSALALALGCLAAMCAGLAIWFGPGAVLTSFMSPIVGGNGHELPGGAARLAIAAWLFTICFSFGSTGAHRVSLSILVPGAPLIVAGLSLAMGYSGSEAGAFAGFSGIFLGVYYLALPFVLYARPAHHWASGRTAPDRESIDSLALVVSLGAITALGLFGVLAASLTLAVGLAFVLRAWRKLPRVERSGVSHTRIAHGLALLALAPPLVLGLAADARRFADGGDPHGKHIRHYAVSPDGRSLAAIFHSDDNPAHGISRVVLLDLDGKAEPRALPPRWAGLEGPCWSSDGRYLAVHDRGVGRLAGESVAQDHDTPRAVTCLFQRVQSTLVVDTKTGELSSLPTCLPTPGWTLPRDLIRITPGLIGEDVLADGRGFTAELQRNESVSIVGCDAGGAIVKTAGGEVRRLSASGFAAVGSSTLWIATATPEHGSTAGEPALASSVQLVRGTESVTVPHVVKELWIGADAYYAETAAGLVRFELPGLAARVLVAAPDFRVVVATERSAHDNRGAPPHLVVRTPSGYRVVDTATGTVAPLEVPAGFSPEIVIGSRVVGRGLHEELLVRDGDGAPRPVFQGLAASK